MLNRGNDYYDSIKIDRPIFILGPHRSGTTLLYRILAKHPDLGYFNRANKRLRNSPFLAHLVTLMGGADNPMEAQRIWDRFWEGDDDVMGAAEATPEVIRWYRHKVKCVLNLRRAKRFVAKYPRLSLRLSWIDTVFPGAIFIHLTRDWRAVVSSTVMRKVKRQQRDGGWFGVRIPGWKDMGDVPHEVAAGRGYRIITQAMEKEGAKYGDRFIKTSYESLCNNPLEVTKELAIKCGLDWTPKFEKTIPTSLRSANYKWREHLDEKMLEWIKEEAEAFYLQHESDV